MAGVVAASALAVLLVACDPLPAADPGGSASPSASPGATPTLVVGGASDVDPDDFLIEGRLGSDPDGDGFWSAHYAFFTDDERTVRCDLRIFSGDAPVTSCAITPGNEQSITYPLPADANCDPSGPNPFDGLSLALGAKGLEPSPAGFSGCLLGADSDPDLNRVTRVLPEGARLAVDPFSCEVTDGVAECRFVAGPGVIRLGLSEATYTV